MSWRAAAILLAAMAWLGTSAVADASVVSMDFVVLPGGRGVANSRYGTAQFRASAGETNQLTIRGSRGRVTFTDPASSVSAGVGCVAEDEHTVTCPSGVDTVDVDTADGADLVSLIGDSADTDTFQYRVRAGSGDDQLTAEHAYGVLDGGPGQDVIEASENGMLLSGGPGRDILTGGPGRDVFALGGAWSPDGDNDQADGGGGIDAVSYTSRQESVTVDLARGIGGDSGRERDRLANIENIYGGAGTDVLIGDDGPNVIYAAPAYAPGDPLPKPTSDWLQGNGGDDQLYGAGGRNQLRGNAGNDQIQVMAGNLVSGGSGDDVLLNGLGVRTDCGAGHDSVQLVEPFEGSASKETDRRRAARQAPQLPQSCERFSTLDLALADTPRRERGSVSLTVRPVLADVADACYRVDVRRRSDGATVGSAEAQLSGKVFRKVRVRLKHSAPYRDALSVVLRFDRERCANRSRPEFASSVIEAFGLPVTPSAASRVRVQFNCGIEGAAPLNTHPLRCFGSSASISELHWHNWGQWETSSKGLLYFAPEYSGSFYRELRVRVTLSDPRPCPSRPGFRYYRRLRLQSRSLAKLINEDGSRWKVPQPQCPAAGREAPIT
jgi:hypothetical protein